MSLWHIAGLHGQKFADRLAAKRLFQEFHYLHDFDRVVAADVVDAPACRAGR